MLLDRRDQCWVDAYGVAQARRNLVTKGPEAIQVLDALLGHLQIAPAVARTVDPDELECLPPKDRPVLAAAIRLGCDALVTGDRKHFGSAYGQEFGGVTIHSPRSLAQTILA